MDDRQRTKLDQEGGDKEYSAWRTSMEGGVVQRTAGLPRAGLRRRRLLTVALCALAATTAWPTRPHQAAIPGPHPEWNVELSSTGRTPVLALVYGPEAGVHVVRVPSGGMPAAERRRISARLARGDVYMMSLGTRGLQVDAKGPPGSNVIAMSATARFVKLYQRPDFTGISTGWW